MKDQLKKSIKNVKLRLLLLSIIINVHAFAQDKTIVVDISDKAKFEVVNRQLSITNKDKKAIIHLNGKENNGIAWIKGLKFEKGIIEFDVKGKDVMQQSFVGIAFHGMNDSTYDAVYFRPFNFQSPDTARKNHSVQYISMPQYDWYMLRQNFTGVYENALIGAISADAWFHAKIIVNADNIKVFVNNDAKPSLVIHPLNNYSTGNIGFWVGNNSDGDFSNLSIQNK